MSRLMTVRIKTCVCVSTAYKTPCNGTTLYVWDHFTKILSCVSNHRNCCPHPSSYFLITMWYFCHPCFIVYIFEHEEEIVCFPSDESCHTLYNELSEEGQVLSHSDMFGTWQVWPVAVKLVVVLNQWQVLRWGPCGNTWEHGLIRSLLAKLRLQYGRARAS